jgi:hypothetical protein
VRDAASGKCLMGDDASRDELMAYQYILDRQKLKLMKLNEISMLARRRPAH